MAENTVQIGVFIPGDSQFLDAACVDVLSMMSKEYMGIIGMPGHVVASTPHVKLHYITTPAQKAAGKVPLTAGAALVPTADTTDAEVQPGKLDIVFVPGPDPNFVLDKASGDFLRGHAETPTTDILCVCTGIFICGQAGILNGRKACGPRGMQSMIKAKFPDIELVGETRRWVQDGNVWSSGGITNGDDMLAAYARTGKRFPLPVVELACKMADVGDRGEFFEQGQTSFTLGIVWQIVRAIFAGKPKSS